MLLISDQASDAEFVAAALDPDAPGAPKTFQVAKVKPAEFAARYRDTLKGHAAVFLLNVEQLDEESWGMLNGYVHEGGGLVVGLGDRCRAENYNGPTASQLLPAQLQEPHTAKAESTFGKIADVTHPLFQRFAKEFEAQFALIPVYRYWVVKPPETSRALLSFSDGAPALLERSFKGAKTGRVLLWTTPLARRAVRTERGAWNELPLFTYWVFPVLTYLTVPYLAGASNEQLNFEAGENALSDPGPRRPIPEFPGDRPRPENHRVAYPLGQQRGPADHRSPVARPVDGDGQGCRRPSDQARLQLEPAQNRKPVRAPASPLSWTRSSARMDTRWPRTPTHSRKSSTRFVSVMRSFPG